MDEAKLQRLTYGQVLRLAVATGLMLATEARRLGKSEIVTALVENDCAFNQRVADIEYLADAACECGS